MAASSISGNIESLLFKTFPVENPIYPRKEVLKELRELRTILDKRIRELEALEAKD